MRKLIFAVLFFLALTGCQTIQTSNQSYGTVKQSTVDKRFEENTDKFTGIKNIIIVLSDAYYPTEAENIELSKMFPHLSSYYLRDRLVIIPRLVYGIQSDNSSVNIYDLYLAKTLTPENTNYGIVVQFFTKNRYIDVNEVLMLVDGRVSKESSIRILNNRFERLTPDMSKEVFITDIGVYLDEKAIIELLDGNDIAFRFSDVNGQSYDYSIGNEAILSLKKYSKMIMHD